MSGSEEVRSLDIDVSRETYERLSEFVELLKKWNRAINLVSRATIESVWQRHIADSAQLFDVAPPNPGHWADLGSGGGLPGVVVGILAAEKAPQMRMTLVEADLRKATFLRQAVRALGIKATVLSERVEKCPPLGADILSARALAPLDQLCGFAQRHLAEGGTAIFPKGANWRAELEVATKSWSFSAESIPSRTDPEAVILKLTSITHV